MPDVFISDDDNQNQEVKAPNTNKLSTSEKPLPFFTSFCEKPNGIEFINQEKDEKIVLFLRRHFIKNIPWISTGIILMVLPILLIVPFNTLDPIRTVIPIRFITIFIIFYYLIIVGFMYLSFITWFYNVGIISTKQVIDIDFTDIMYREVAKVRIEDVIDAEYTQGGFLHSFFNYGNTFIQTEGVKPNFEFHSIPNPDKATDIIMDIKGGNLNA